MFPGIVEELGNLERTGPLTATTGRAAVDRYDFGPFWVFATGRICWCGGTIRTV